MYPPVAFFENIINELLGGGICCWLSIGKDNEYLNTTNLDVFEYVENFKSIIKNNTPGLTETALLKKITNTLYYSIVKKYNSIKQKQDEVSKAMYWTDEKRISIVKCIEAFKLGHLLFKERRFLKYPIKELKGEGKLYWFDLNNDGNVVSNDKCNRINYNALTELDYFVSIDGEVGFETVYMSILKKCADKLARETQNRYNDLRHGTASNSLAKRQEIINCINNWILCEKVTKNKEYINNCLNEILGNGICDWFVLNEEFELVSTPECATLGFDANIYQELQKNTTLVIDTKQVLQKLIANEFKQITIDYQKIKVNALEEGNISNRILIIQLFKKCKKCYENYPRKEFLQFMINELEGNGKLPWIGSFFIFWKTNHAECNTIGFNAIAELALLQSF